MLLVTRVTHKCNKSKKTRVKEEPNQQFKICFTLGYTKNRN